MDVDVDVDGLCSFTVTPDVFAAAIAAVGAGSGCRPYTMMGTWCTAIGVDDVDEGEAIDNARLVGTACTENSLLVCVLLDLPLLPLESPFSSTRVPRRAGSGAGRCDPKGSTAVPPFTE